MRDADPADACPICASHEPAEAHGFREMLFGSRETFAYLRCPTCGALRIAEPPADLARHYPPAYYAGPVTTPTPPASPVGWLGRAAGAARDRTTLIGDGRRRTRWLRHWAPSLSPEVRRASVFTKRAGLRSFDDPILDVGCGRNALNLANLRELGFRRLLGIDPFLEADDVFRGVPLRRQSIHEVDGTFQAITFHHSFEHVPDPEATLVAAARHLRPGGVVLIRTPVVGGWFWEHFGRDWWELDPPRHLWVHSTRSLDLLAASAGLAVTDVVWDSSFIEVIASDQIARDIAWREPRSWGVDPPAGYSDEVIDGYKTLVTELNATGRAGRAGFYLRRAADAPAGSAT